jgi:hypothetical protein
MAERLGMDPGLGQALYDEALAEAASRDQQ